MSLKNIWRKSGIRKKYINAKQAKYMDEIRAGSNNRLIVFLVPGYDRVNGGLLSIISLAEETEKLKEYHKSDIFVCTVPGDPPLIRFTKFNNSTHVVDLQMLLDRIKDNGRILIHIPEIFVERSSKILCQMSGTYPQLTWQFNILLQNVDLIPNKNYVELLLRHGKTTCTTAHQAYSNTETEKLIGCPVHHFSVWVSPGKYIKKNYSEKNNLIVISPDKHPRRKEIIDYLKSRLNSYEFKVIKNMTYEEYKKVISVAKFSLTFGEGLDGYLIEPVFSGSIGCAVYNDRFFTRDMGQMPFIYQSWDELLVKFPEEVKSADNLYSYSIVNSKQFTTLASYYSHENYTSNLVNYYENVVTL